MWTVCDRAAPSSLSYSTKIYQRGLGKEEKRGRKKGGGELYGGRRRGGEGREDEKICEEMEERRMGEACMKEGEGQKEKVEEG